MSTVPSNTDNVTTRHDALLDTAVHLLAAVEARYAETAAALRAASEYLDEASMLGVRIHGDGVIRDVPPSSIPERVRGSWYSLSRDDRRELTRCTIELIRRLNGCGFEVAR